MIQRHEVEGRMATVTYMKKDWTPCHAKAAEFVKIAFDDGQVVFAVPRQKEGAA
jgi:hypothetical protein